MTRILSGLVAGGITIAGVVLLSSEWLAVLAIVLMTVGAVEMVALGRAGSSGPGLLVLPVLVPALSLAFVFVSPTLTLVGLALVPLAAACGLLWVGGEPTERLSTLGWLSFGTPYLVVPACSLYLIHSFEPRLLLVFLVSVWANDSAAYFVGRSLGRHKIAPVLSPNKTVEGSIGGLVGGAAVGALGLLWSGEWAWPVLLALVVALGAAQAGDLVESLLKRAVGRKDSGTLLPGHGGALDRLDAIILAAPVFWALVGFETGWSL